MYNAKLFINKNIRKLLKYFVFSHLATFLPCNAVVSGSLYIEWDEVKTAPVHVHKQVVADTVHHLSVRAARGVQRQTHPYERASHRLVTGIVGWNLLKVDCTARLLSFTYCFYYITGYHSLDRSFKMESSLVFERGLRGKRSQIYSVSVYAGC